MSLLTRQLRCLSEPLWQGLSCAWLTSPQGSFAEASAALCESVDPQASRHAGHAAASTSAPGLWHQHLTHARCMHTASMYSAKTGRARPSPWPTLERLQSPAAQPGQLKWQRTVLRPPAEVQIVQDGSTLVLTGRAGSVKVNLSDLDPTGLVAFKLVPVLNTDALTQKTARDSSIAYRSTIIVASPSQPRFQSVVSALEGAFQGVMQGYMVALTVKGVGYRLEPGDDAAEAGAGRRKYFEQVTNEKATINYPYNKPVSALRLRVGFSKPVIFTLPPSMRAFCLKPTLTYLYGLEQDKLQELAQEIRSIRKPNAYTGNGIQLVGETVKVKQRSSKKSK